MADAKDILLPVVGPNRGAIQPLDLLKVADKKRKRRGGREESTDRLLRRSFSHSFR